MVEEFFPRVFFTWEVDRRRYTFTGGAGMEKDLNLPIFKTPFPSKISKKLFYNGSVCINCRDFSKKHMIFTVTQQKTCDLYRNFAKTSRFCRLFHLKVTFSEPSHFDTWFSVVWSKSLCAPDGVRIHGTTSIALGSKGTTQAFVKRRLMLTFYR